MDSAQLFTAAVRSLFRYKFSAAFVFLCTLLLVLVAIAVFPRKYRSEAKLFVRLGRETVALDPTATTGQTVAVQSSREIEVRSVRDMLGSRNLLEQVVDTVGPELVLDPPTDIDSDGSPNPGRAVVNGQANHLGKIIDKCSSEAVKWAEIVGLIDPVPDRDRAVQDLQQALEVDGGSKSSVISVEYVSATPESAKQILEAFLDAYRELHVRVNRAPENYEFFEVQTEQLRQQLEEARSKLERLKNDKGVIAIEIRKQNLQDHVSQMDVSIRDAGARLAAAEASLNLSKGALELLPDRLVTDEIEGIGDAARDSIRNSLYQMQMEAERVKQAYSEGHPERVRVLAELASVQAIYDDEDKERPTRTLTVNRSHQEMQIKVIDTEALRASTTAELKELKTQREEVQAELKTLNQTEVLLASLQERVDLLQDSHRQYAENLELSRIDQELQKREISNVSVVQPPSLILKPVSPNKRLVLGLGLILAAMNALGFAMWRNRRSLSSAIQAPATLAMGTEQALDNRASEPHLPRLRQNGTTSGSRAVASVAEKQAVNGPERKRQMVTTDLDEEPSVDDESLSDQPGEKGKRLVLPR